MWQEVVDRVGDPCERVVVAPYLERAAAELSGTRFESLLAPACQEQQLADFAHTLWTYAEDVVARLVAARLAKQSPLWAIDVRLAPAAEVARARGEVAEKISASDGAALTEAAPLLRAELERQTSRFVNVSIETCERIWDGRHAIAAELLGRQDGEFGQIIALGVDHGDCHDGGRRTTVVDCEAGRFVYKPHDCRIEVWFKEVAERHLPGVLVQPTTLLREDGTGAWAFQEFMWRRPVADEAGLARFWRNTGRAWALFQALGSEDLHGENFIAVGEHPSLIDCETVITSEPAMRGDPLTSPNPGYASKGFGRDLAGTLCVSSLLPSPVWPTLDERETEAGQGPVGNTSPLLARGLSCLPVLDGQERDVLGFEDELLAGLEEGLEAVAREADGLAADVRAASGVPVRRLIRDTGVYALLLARMRRADAYTPSVREGLLDALHRPLVRGQEATRSPLATSEATCLAEGDVPYFYAAAGSRKIVGSDGTADDRLLEASAAERALGRIASLDGAHNAFAGAVAEANVRRAVLPGQPDVPACVPAGEPFAAEDALAEVGRVFSAIERLAVVAPSGEESWLFRSMDKGVLGRSTVAYGGGLGGMAAFLAAFASHAGEMPARDRALELLEGCLARIDEAMVVLEAAQVVPEDSVGLGLVDGLGGVVRSLDVVTRALGGAGDERLGAFAAELLRRSVALVEKADIEGARHLDTYAGAAGLLLALSQCSQATEGGRAREVAQRLACRLLDARTLAAKDGMPLWDTITTGWPVGGFGHGQAGIAAALAAAEGAFSIDVGVAAREALAWELGSYSEKLGTWPDLRSSPVSSGHMHGMCSGAPGIGLAALAVRDTAVDRAACELADGLLERADAACRTLPPNHRDTLCCGNASIVEYLLSRGLADDAGRLLAGMAVRARRLGSYFFYHRGTCLVDEPDLLHGLAGVGYELVRYADPALPGVFVG